MKLEYLGHHCYLIGPPPYSGYQNLSPHIISFNIIVTTCSLKSPFYSPLGFFLVFFNPVWIWFWIQDLSFSLHWLQIQEIQLLVAWNLSLCHLSFLILAHLSYAWHKVAITGLANGMSITSQSVAKYTANDVSLSQLAGCSNKRFVSAPTFPAEAWDLIFANSNRYLELVGSPCVKQEQLG